MEEQHEFTDYPFPQGGGACFTMCFYSAYILSCVRDFHISHTLVNHNWTVVTQKKNSKHVCFQFGPRGPAKAEAGSETTSLSDLLASSPPKTAASPALLSLTPTVCSAAGVGFRCQNSVWGGWGSRLNIRKLQKQSLECCLVTKSNWMFYLAFQNYTVYSTQKEFLIFLLMQQLNFLSNWMPVYTRRCPVRHESSLGFIVPLLDFLWYVAAVLICTRLLKASQGLIFGSCKWNQALLVCTSIPSLGSARPKTNGF